MTTANLKLDYDPEGRMAKYSSDGGTTWTQFVYDGTNLLVEYNNAGAIAERYLFGEGTDDPIIWFHGYGMTTLRYFDTNYQGSVIARRSEGGVMSDATRYGAYGEPEDANGDPNWFNSVSSLSRFRYTGQIALPEAQLYYYKARIYDPAFARFLQTDPVGSKDDLDLYAYTHDDPINGTDPTGLTDYTCPTNCKVGTHLVNGDTVRVENVGFMAISKTNEFTIGAPISRGSSSQLTDQQVGNVVFNETRSLSGDSVDQARVNVANAVLNGDESLGTSRPQTASTSANPPTTEGDAWGSAQVAVVTAKVGRALGYDPTDGGVHFNLRKNDSTTPFQGHDLTTQSGPLNNSYPTKALPKDDIYVNTYN